MRNGGPNVAEVQVHPDTRCQAMLEQVREAEIAQAVDRVRPVFNRRRIIVLTNVALDLTVDHALTWPELRPGKFAYAFARHGVLPLSAKDLCRGFPDLWRLENTAKVELSRAGFYTNEKGVHSQIDISIWSFVPYFSGRATAARIRGAPPRERWSTSLCPIPARSWKAWSASWSSSTSSARLSPQASQTRRTPHRNACRHCRGSQPPCPQRGTCSPPCRQMSDRLMCSAWPA